MPARGIDTVCEYGNIELPNLIFKVELSGGGRGGRFRGPMFFSAPYGLCFNLILKKRYSQNMLLPPLGSNPGSATEHTSKYFQHTFF